LGQFAIHVAFLAHRVADETAEHFAVALAKTEDRDVQRAHRNSGLRRDLDVALLAAAEAQERRQKRKQFALSLGLVFAAQRLERRLESRQRPAPRKKFIGRAARGFLAKSL